MPKQIKVTIPDPDEVVTRRILAEEFEKFEKRFDKKLDEKFDRKFEGYSFDLNTKIAAVLENFTKTFVTKEQYLIDMEKIMSDHKLFHEEFAATLANLNRQMDKLEDHDKRIDTLEKRTGLIN